MRIEAARARHPQPVAVLQRQLHGEKVRLTPADRTLLAALLHRPPATCSAESGCWHAPTPCRADTAISSPDGTPTPRTRSVPDGHRRSRQSVLGVKAAPSTMRETLNEAGTDPAPQRTPDSRSTFPRSQAEATITADFSEAVTLTGTPLYVPAVIEHATRRVHIPDATAHEYQHAA
ncbi:hypothetical protein GCM10010199_11840 [Dactylosporangium roseum]